MQDKMQVLAEWLKVEPEVLRFGESVRKSVQSHRQLWATGIGFQERETIEAFLALSASDRKVVREVIAAFAKAERVN